MRNGWNSPGRSAVRERELATTGARSAFGEKAALARQVKMIKQIAPDPKGTPSRLGSRPSEPRRGTLWVGSGVLVRVIISARRVHRIQRWRSNRCLALEDDIDRRQNAQGRKGGDDQTADDRSE